MTGIYKIVNIENQKFYIGSAKDMHQRWSAHKSLLNRQAHHNSYLQNAWNKYGESCFEFEVVEEVSDVGKLVKREQHWLDKTKACEIGYNLQPFAHNSLGRILSEETKNKIRAKSIGRKHNKETRIKMAKSRLGEKNGMYGKKHTEETKQMIGKTKQGTNIGGDNHFYGKAHTEEVKRKIGEANKGNKGNTKLTVYEVIEIKKELKTRINSLHINPFIIN